MVDTKRSSDDCVCLTRGCQARLLGPCTSGPAWRPRVKRFLNAFYCRATSLRLLSGGPPDAGPGGSGAAEVHGQTLEEPNRRLSLQSHWLQFRQQRFAEQKAEGCHGDVGQPEREQADQFPLSGRKSGRRRRTRSTKHVIGETMTARQPLCGPQPCQHGAIKSPNLRSLPPARQRQQPADWQCPEQVARNRA